MMTLFLRPYNKNILLQNYYKLHIIYKIVTKIKLNLLITNFEIFKFVIT